MTTSTAPHGLIIAVDGEDRLAGACCESCGTHTFPAQLGCPRCGAAMANVALPAEGVLWSWTVQRIRPKPPYQGPEEYEPFAVGYVELGPLRLETRLAGKPVDAWRIGEPVRLVAGPPDEAGEVWSFWFEPNPADQEVEP
jgi:uncharacterized OB-fold protein